MADDLTNREKQLVRHLDAPGNMPTVEYTFDECVTALKFLRARLVENEAQATRWLDYLRQELEKVRRDHIAVDAARTMVMRHLETITRADGSHSAAVIPVEAEAHGVIQRAMDLGLGTEKQKL